MNDNEIKNSDLPVSSDTENSSADAGNLDVNSIIESVLSKKEESETSAPTSELKEHPLRAQEISRIRPESYSSVGAPNKNKRTSLPGRRYNFTNRSLRAVLSSDESEKRLSAASPVKPALVVEEVPESDENIPPRKKPYTFYRFLGNPIITIVLFSVLVLFCAAATFFTPSASTIIEANAVVAQRNAISDINSGITLMTTNIVNEVQGMDKIYLLPVTDSPGTKYSKKNASTYKDSNGITHSVYEDSTISVDLWKEKKKIDGKKIVASYAKVKIAHPTQLRTSAFKSGNSRRAKTTLQAKKNNAIVAVNGDFFTLRKTGVIIKQGTYYRKSKSGRQTLFIDSEGNFHIMSATKAITSGFLKTHTIYNTLSFGPPLVKDGKQCKYTSSTKDKIAPMHFGLNPRTGIGQLGELEYLLIVVDGRTSESSGLITNQFAKLFYDAGCINAYNLDGGQSSTISYLGSIYNKASNSGERDVSDIVYFASAEPADAN